MTQQNASLFSNPPLVYLTLYASPLITLTKHGYTKHYYAGTDLCASREQSQACLSYAEMEQSVRSNRICAKTGGGFGESITRSLPDLQAAADSLFSQSRENIRCRELLQNDMACVVSYGHVSDAEMNVHLYEMPSHFRSDAEIHLGEFHSVVEWCEHGSEEEGHIYFYHSDHLGSASWITDAQGDAIQHLQYLPFGAPFVDQRISGYSERFTFTGKERDEETGYGYFGARYMDHELMTSFISVDPMSDKYPSISPYAYCAGNPVKLVDPDGREAIDEEDWYKDKNGYVHWDANVHFQKDLKNGEEYLGKTIMMVAEGSDEVTYGDQYGHTHASVPLREVSISETLTDFERTMHNPLVQSIHQSAADFWGYPVTEAVVDATLFVVTGGVSAGLGKSAIKKIGQHQAKNYFKGAKYTDKVFGQMSHDLLHGFPKSVEGFAAEGGAYSIKMGGDFKLYRWLTVKGSYGNATGTFEFIKDSKGMINHRFFNAK